MKRLFYKEWTPESNAYCCINCGREHLTALRMNDKLGFVYTLNFCSDKCINQFMEKHTTTWKDGNHFLAPHHKKEFMKLWKMKYKSPKKFEELLTKQDADHKKKGYTNPNQLYSHSIKPKHTKNRWIRMKISFDVSKKKYKDLYFFISSVSNLLDWYLIEPDTHKNKFNVTLIPSDCSDYIESKKFIRTAKDILDQTEGLNKELGLKNEINTYMDYDETGDIIILQKVGCLEMTFLLSDKEKYDSNDSLIGTTVKEFRELAKKIPKNK